jgi:hypothetical protein
MIRKKRPTFLLMMILLSLFFIFYVQCVFSKNTALSYDEINIENENSNIISKIDIRLIDAASILAIKRGENKQSPKVKKKPNPVKKKKNQGLSGSFSIKKSLHRKKKALSAGISWKPDPKDYYSIKFGLKKDLMADHESVTYSWGVGYDDWHEGPWAAQINHWGGIKAGEGLDSQNAIASLGYKFDTEFLKKYKLKSAITLARQLNEAADFKVSASLGWSPRQYWTIKAILVKGLNDEDPVWNYTIGYDDWHAGTFGIEYSNYSGSSLYETKFKQGGSVAINYKWAF